MRALRAHQGVTADPDLWKGQVEREYRRLLIENATEKVVERIDKSGKRITRVTRKGISKEQGIEERKREGTMPAPQVLRCRIRYFTDGAVIGSRDFVNQAFAHARERSGPKRRTGARKLHGVAEKLSGTVWSFRDLRKGV